MTNFLVKSNIQKDGKLYEPGSKIELSEKEAAEMPWAVEKIRGQGSGARAQGSIAEKTEDKPKE